MQNLQRGGTVGANGDTSECGGGGGGGGGGGNGGGVKRLHKTKTKRFAEKIRKR